jgi:hypothetical protein
VQITVHGRRIVRQRCRGINLNSIDEQLLQPRLVSDVLRRQKAFERCNTRIYALHFPTFVGALNLPPPP